VALRQRLISPAFPFGGAAGGVALRFRVVGEPGENDGVQGAVELAIAAAV
jgi:hypothetical protein